MIDNYSREKRHQNIKNYIYKSNIPPQAGAYRLYAPSLEHMN